METKLLNCLANGDVAGFLALSEHADPALLARVNKSMEHLSDVASYKNTYGFGSDVITPLPPEVESGNLLLDTRQSTIIDYMRAHGGKRHLDIASSNGILLMKARLEGLTEYGLGIELSTARVANAEAGVKHLGITNIEFINSMFEEATVEGLFDIITAGEVLEHVIDPVAFLARAASLLSPGGIVITTVPVGRPPMSPEEVDNVTSDVPREHVRYLSRAALVEVAAQAGLKEASCTIEGHSWVNLISTWTVK